MYVTPIRGHVVDVIVISPSDLVSLGIHLIGVCLMGVHLIGMYLMGVHLSWVCISWATNHRNRELRSVHLLTYLGPTN
jgi:hypothetical protein